MKKRGQVSSFSSIILKPETLAIIAILVILVLAYAILNTKGVGLLDKIKNLFIFWK